MRSINLMLGEIIHNNLEAPFFLDQPAANQKPPYNVNKRRERSANSVLFTEPLRRSGKNRVRSHMRGYTHNNHHFWLYIIITARHHQTRGAR